MYWLNITNDKYIYIYITIERNIYSANKSHTSKKNGTSNYYSIDSTVTRHVTISIIESRIREKIRGSLANRNMPKYVEICRTWYKCEPSISWKMILWKRMSSISNITLNESRNRNINKTYEKIFRNVIYSKCNT